MTKHTNFWWDEMVAILCLLNFLFGTEVRMSPKNHEEGFGMVTVGIHPTDFKLDPTKIPPGGVVQNCRGSPPSSLTASICENFRTFYQLKMIH